MTIRVLCIAAMLACLLTTQARLFACECVGPVTTCLAAELATAVFVGQVIDITKRGVAVPDAPPAGANWRRVSFKVAESLRGDVPEAVIVFTGSGGGDCGYDFSAGKSYLVYASKAPTGQLTTGICARTREATRAVQNEIKELRALAHEPRKCVQLFVGLFDADCLAGKDLTHVNLPALATDAPATGDDGGPVMRGILELVQSPVDPLGCLVAARGRRLVERLPCWLVRCFVGCGIARVTQASRAAALGALWSSSVSVAPST